MGRHFIGSVYSYLAAGDPMELCSALQSGYSGYFKPLCSFWLPAALNGFFVAELLIVSQKWSIRAATEAGVQLVTVPTAACFQPGAEHVGRWGPIKSGRTFNVLEEDLARGSGLAQAMNGAAMRAATAHVKRLPARFRRKS